MRVALIPREPDAAANDRWPEPARRAAAVVSLHPHRPRLRSEVSTIGLRGTAVARTQPENLR